MEAYIYSNIHTSAEPQHPGTWTSRDRELHRPVVTSIDLATWRLPR